MAILSILVFGTALTAAVWTIYATVKPDLARIADLLANGPVATPLVATPVPARSSLRNVRVRGSVSAPRAPQRAAA